MRHPSLSAGEIDWPATRLVIFGQDDAFRFMARSTFRKLAAGEVFSTSVATDMPTFLAQAPHLALLDLGGEPRAALAVLAALRSAAPVLPVLVVHKGGEAERVAEARALGIEGILPKPVSGHELMVRAVGILKAPQRLPADAGGTARLRPGLRPSPAIPPPPEGGPADPAAGRAVVAEITRLAGRLGAAAASAPAGGHRPGPGTYGGGEPGRSPDLRPAGGKLGADDVVPAAPRKGGATLDAAPSPDDAARRKAEKAQREWRDSLGQAGHEARTGGDVAGLDVAAVVAAHAEWLQSQGRSGRRANFEGMDLAGAGLSGAVLAGAALRRAELSDSCLAEARLDGADLRFAVLSAADCGGAVLAVAQLRHADLRLSNLQGASFRGADLSGALLAGADFAGATLVETDLREADLSQAENLRQAQLDKAVADHTTRLPPGLSRRRPPE